jgi:hypothetical protein
MAEALPKLPSRRLALHNSVVGTANASRLVFRSFPALCTVEEVHRIPVEFQSQTETKQSGRDQIWDHFSGKVCFGSWSVLDAHGEAGEFTSNLSIT